MAIKVLLYEDNAELRASLSSLITFSEDLRLAAAFEHCAEVKQHLDRYDPDIVLMDIDMPVANGISGLAMIRSVNEQLPVVMLTVFDDNKHILEAIMNGATGYILKRHLATRLVSAIHEALNGGAPMSPAVALLLLRYVSSQKDRKNQYALTLREKDILQSLTDGNSYKMIAAHLGIAQGTVSTHIKSIYEKLGVHSQAEAVSKTLREGLL